MYITKFLSLLLKVKGKMESGSPVTYNFVTWAHCSVRRPQWNSIHDRLESSDMCFLSVNLLLDRICPGFYCPVLPRVSKCQSSGESRQSVCELKCWVSVLEAVLAPRCPTAMCDSSNLTFSFSHMCHGCVSVLRLLSFSHSSWMFQYQVSHFLQLLVCFRWHLGRCHFFGGISLRFSCLFSHIYQWVKEWQLYVISSESVKYKRHECSLLSFSTLWECIICWDAFIMRSQFQPFQYTACHLDTTFLNLTDMMSLSLVSEDLCTILY